MSDQKIKIKNGYTTVIIQRVDTGNGERISIRSPKLGLETKLDPLQLESLCWQDKEIFSGFLQDPFGPEEDIEYPD